jgi:hypothetical protein
MTAEGTVGAPTCFRCNAEKKNIFVKEIQACEIGNSVNNFMPFSVLASLDP